MKLGKVAVFGLALVAPALAAAQTRPANTMHTNSAELYFDRAKKENREDEKKKLLDKALEFALQGVKAKADNPKAYLLAGRIYVQLGNAAAADSMLDKAEQLYPEYAKETDIDRQQAWVKAYNAGVLAMRDRKTDEALVQFEAANAIWNKRPGALLNIAQIHGNRAPDKAIAAYKGALEILRGPARQGLKPDEEKQWKEFEEAATFNMAQILATAGKNEEALTAYRDFLQRNPDSSLAMSNMAVVLTRMGKTEEASKIYADLLAKDLTGPEFFNAGVGLFRANQYGPAADAFRKSIAKNPHFRDAYYNMSQALYQQARDLVEERDKVKTNPAQLKTVDAKLTPVVTELAELTDKLRTMDPGSRNVVIMQAFAFRALGDLTAADAAKSNEWKNKTLNALKINEALNYDVQDVTLTTAGEDVQIAGNVVNFKAKVGDALKLRFHFVGANGQVLGTQEVTVNMPEVQAAAPFKVTLKSKDEVAGWKYEILP